MNHKLKYIKYKKKYLDLKNSIGGMNLVANVKKLSSNSSLSDPISGSVNTDQVQDIVNYMLDDCGQKLMGYPRGDYNLPGDFINNYMFKDVGPSWACNKPISNLEEKLGDLLGQGMVCIGLISILLRCVLRDGKKMPSLDPNNYGEYTDLSGFSKDLTDPNWKGDNKYSLVFGLNDTREWLYIYTYGGKSGKIKQFSKSAFYPRGTLLFRCLDPYTYGHVAMVYTDKAKYEDTTVFHTIAFPVGENKVAIEPLSYSHEYFSR